MPAAVTNVEAPSEKIIFVNREAWQISERVHSQTMPQEPGDYANRCRNGKFEMLHPDGRPYEMEEWPLMRSIRSDEEVRGEEFIHPLAEGPTPGYAATPLRSTTTKGA
jgi:hypothetical protein